MNEIIEKAVRLYFEDKDWKKYLRESLNNEKNHQISGGNKCVGVQ